MTQTQKQLVDWGGELLKSVGVPTAVCAFVLWWGSDQINRLAEDAREDRAYIRATLTALVAEGNQQSAKSTDALIQATEAITETRLVLERIKHDLDLQRDSR